MKKTVILILVTLVLGLSTACNGDVYSVLFDSKSVPLSSSNSTKENFDPESAIK